MKVFQYEDITIKLGQTAKENTFLVKNSNPNYVWIHLESFPSGHVVIECENPSKEVINYSMNVCLEGTKQKNMKDVKLSVTKISNLKTTDILGEVEFKSKKKVESLKIFY